jgi:hypothetical protein
MSLVLLLSAPFILPGPPAESYSVRLAILLTAIALTTISGWFGRE